METQPPQKGSKISNTEWFLVITAVALVDITQVVLDVLLIGIVVNRIIDLFVGVALAFYFKIRGVRMDSKKIAALVGSFVLEEVGVASLEALPLWTGDVIMTMLWDKADKNLPNLPI